jgi:hypothetical protein
MKEKDPAYNIVDDTIYIMFNNTLVQGTVTEFIKQKIKEKDWAAVYAHVTKKIQKKREDNALTNLGIIDGKLAGRPIPQVILKKVEQLIENDVPIKPLVRMLDDLLNMPDNLQGKSKEQRIIDCFNFLQAHSEFPITEDGAFLAWKKIQDTDDNRSFMTNSEGEHLYYPIGDFVSLSESEVDSDSNRPCSRGIHACARSYLPSFMGERGKVVILKIFPSDVRACPSDYGCAKLRCVRAYTVAYADEDTMKMAFSTGVHYESQENYNKDLLEETDIDDYNEWKDEVDNEEIEEIGNDEIKPTVLIRSHVSDLNMKILNAFYRYWEADPESATFRRVAKNMKVNYDDIEAALLDSNFSVVTDDPVRGNWYVTLG